MGQKWVLLSVIIFFGTYALASDRSFEIDRLLKEIESTARDTRSELDLRETGDRTPFTCQGRLTLQSGVPVTTTDISGASTLYFTRFQGSRIALHTGSWVNREFNEISLALSGLTSGMNYDVFVYDNSGTPALELQSWSNNTARSVSLVYLSNIWVKSTATTRRYVGTLRTTGTNTTEDSASKRFLWNFYHRRWRPIGVTESADSWTYGTASPARNTNNSTSNKIEFVVGFDESVVSVRTLVVASAGATARVVMNGVGFDATASATTENLKGGQARNTFRQQLWSRYFERNILGYHVLNWVEAGNTDEVFYGDAGDASGRVQSGIFGLIEG